MEIFKKEKKHFSTIELIVSMAIIMILAGVFLLNYNLKREVFDLNNALSITKQEVRKAQSLIMAQTVRPQKCSTNPGISAQNYAVVFEKEGSNYVSLFADQGTSDSCNIEDKYFSPSIKISKITVRKGLNSSTPNSAWISFAKDTLAVTISDGTNNDWSEIEVEFCIKSNCTDQNKKTIKINNKGMID